MIQAETVYVLGCGAIGLTLSAHLAAAGKNVIAVRTSVPDVEGEIKITVRNAHEVTLEISVRTVSLSRLPKLDGIVVITAKSYANRMLATALSNKTVTGPLVIMQNGLGVEDPFLESRFSQICRCVLYATGQRISENEVTFLPIASSPIGILKGSEFDLERCVRTLTTREFPFHPEKNIQRDIWKKAVINSVFNSICPLLDVDNGIFVRNAEAAKLAREIVNECLILAEAKNISLHESELMEQIMNISKGSDGVFISTLQDIRNGRQTEIESLNLEMSRMASSLSLDLPQTRLLGKMILVKGGCQMGANHLLPSDLASPGKVLP